MDDLSETKEETSSEKIEPIVDDLKDDKDIIDAKWEDVPAINDDNIQDSDERNETEIPPVEISNTNTIDNEAMHYNNAPINNFNNKDKNDKDMKKIIIVMIIIFVLFIAGLVWYFLTSGQKEEQKEQTSNKDYGEVELTHTDVLTPTEGIYLTDVSEVVDNVMPSIVAITSKTLVTSGLYGPNFFGREQYATGAGSGIIVAKTNKELMILTNNHVIDGATELSVQFINDKNADAKVKGSSASKDVAIITVDLSELDDETINSIKIATMGDSNALKVGNGVVAIGNALGYGQSVTTGVISALNRAVSIDNVTTNMIQIDAAINGGNSGGALINSKGEVIGINSAKYSSSGYSSQASIEGMGFAIPISDVSDLITQLMNGETLSEKTRGYLGISGYMITTEYSEAYGMPKGFYISSIVENSGADKAGLSIGNIVTHINGKEVTQFADISEVLELKKAKEKVTLTIKYISGRQYKEKDVTVTLSSYDEVN